MKELASESVALIKDNRLDLSQLAGWGASVAGPVSKGFVTTSNTAVDLKRFPLAEHFHREFIAALRAAGYENLPPILESPDTFKILNDAEAGALGEYYHPHGSLRGVALGMYLILGTGLGGALIRNGLIVPGANEIGHIVLYDKRTGSYKVMLLDKLADRGWFDPETGRFEEDAEMMNPYIFAEHRLTGPFLAVRLVQESIQLGENNRQMLSDAINEYHRRQGIDSSVSVKALGDLIAFNPGDRAHWASMSNDSTILPILRWLMSLEPEDHDSACKIRGHPYPRAVKFGFKFQRSFVGELGLVASELYNFFGNRDPNFRIVIGSGLGESLRDKPTAIRALHKIMTQDHLHRCTKDCKQLVISGLTGEKREAVGLCSSPNDPWVRDASLLQ